MCFKTMELSERHLITYSYKGKGRAGVANATFFIVYCNVLLLGGFCSSEVIVLATLDILDNHIGYVITE